MVQLVKKAEIGIAVGLMLMLGACGGSQPAGTNNAAAVAPANQAAAVPTNAQAPKKAEEQDAAPEAAGGDVGVPMEVQEAHDDRSAPTRRARCKINDEGLESCAFTPVMGDGSFDIETEDRMLRLLVSDGEGALFERIGPRNIPLPGTFERDQEDRACWFSNDEFATVRRLCAY